MSLQIELGYSKTHFRPTFRLRTVANDFVFVPDKQNDRTNLLGIRKDSVRTAVEDLQSYEGLIEAVNGIGEGKCCANSPSW